MNFYFHRLIEEKTQKTFFPPVLQGHSWLFHQQAWWPLGLSRLSVTSPECHQRIPASHNLQSSCSSCTLVAIWNLTLVCLSFWQITTLQIYTTTLHLFYNLKDVLLQPMKGTNTCCTPIQLIYIYFTANSRINDNNSYEQLIFVRITTIGCKGKYVHLFYNWKDVLWVWALLVTCW